MCRMGKYWFKHDHGARNDPKLQRVIMRLGHEGKSVFWDIIEMLYEQGGTLPLSECESYAFTLHTSLKIIKSLISDFDLFNNNGKVFWSNRVSARLKEFSDKSGKAAESVKVRWDRARKQQSGIPVTNGRNTNVSKNNTPVIQEYRIENIDKENNTPLPPKGDGAVFSPDSPKTDERVEAGATKPLIKPLEFPSPEFEAIWREWTEHKQIEKRKAYKSVLAEQKGINHLVDLSGGKVAHARQIVDQSMAQNWQGLFALKTPFVAVRANTGEPRKETLEEIKARIKFVP